MAGFSGVDFIDFDSQLNDEEKLVRQTARQFVDNEVIPIIEKHSREGTFPKHLVPQLGELGFFGASLDGYGCAGMSNVAYGLVMQELERGDSGLRSFVSVQSALVMYPIPTSGSAVREETGLARFDGPLTCLPQARYGIGWGAIGAAMACYDTALQYAKSRKQFQNKPIASHQLVPGKLKDQNRLDPTHVSMLKMNNVWIAMETARKARDILGANGIVDDYCIMRHMNNLESVSTYEGTHDIHKLVIGERITGISAFV